MISYNQLYKEIAAFTQTLLFNIKREGFLFTCKKFPYHLKMRIMEINEAFDKKYGTDTSETALIYDLEPIGEHSTDASAYAPTISSVFNEALEHLDVPHNEYSFIDLGSGKGRTLLLAAKYPFKKIIGVEFCKKLHAIAKSNIEIFKSKTGVKNNFELHLEDAAKYQFPSGNLLVYLFNPFDEKITSIIMDNLKKSESDEPRKIVIIYWHPLFDKHIEQMNIKLIQQKDAEHYIYGWKIYSNGAGVKYPHP